MEEMMHADKVEVSWDPEKAKWLARITSGEEVIRRHFDAPKNADEKTLQSAAQQTATDEGYEADAISIRR
jgi:hypothetical protein